MSSPTPAHARTVTLLTRAGCGACVVAEQVLADVLGGYGLEAEVIDVDEVASTDPDLRAEFGDRLPVVLLDGVEHSYWDVDVRRLQLDLGPMHHGVGQVRRDLGLPERGGS